MYINEKKNTYIKKITLVVWPKTAVPGSPEQASLGTATIDSGMGKVTSTFSPCPCPGFRVQGAGCRVQGAGFRVQGSGCRVQGAGCRVQGSGLAHLPKKNRQAKSAM